METVDWGDIQLDEEQYTLQAFPTSSLSDDLTGRLAEIQELAQAGYIDPQTSFHLLEMHDLEKNNALQTAPYDLLCKLYDEMIHDGKPQRFEAAFMNAQLAQKIGLQYLNYAMKNDCPEKHIQLIRDFLSQVNTEGLNVNPGVVAPQAPQAAMQMGAAPMANPTATPTSNLIPNIAGGAQ
jgi:hypothetical protein